MTVAGLAPKISPYVGADLKVMELDTIRMRTTPKGLKPFVMTNLKPNAGLAEVVAFIETKGMLQAGRKGFALFADEAKMPAVKIIDLEAWQSG